MSDLENKEIFSRNLKYYMSLFNKTRNDICKDLGFSYTTFTSWYNGDFYPRIDKIEMLSNYFNIEKSDLIEEHNNSVSEFDEQFKICGQRLFELRTRMGLTIEELSQKTNISIILLERYEKGIVAKMKQTTISDLADFYNVNPVWLMGYDVPKENIIKKDYSSKSAIVFVYGTIPAGVPIECIEDIIDTEEISIDILKDGKQYFGLKIKGDSMYPEYLDGDILILEKVEDCESGDDCVVMVNGNDGTFKRVFKNEEQKTITLQPLNMNLGKDGRPLYEPITFTNEQIENLPVRIIGIVNEIRRKKKRK